jgi:ribose 5-phosphate isomerase B
LGVKLFIAADHAGFELKEHLRASAIPGIDIEWIDLGTDSKDSVHYPDFAAKLCNRILSTKVGPDRNDPAGVLVCGSGQGVAISANRFKGIRAAVVWRPEIAALSRSHNGANVLCLPANWISRPEALEILRTWLTSRFEGGRHQTRVDLMDKLG